MSGGVKEVSAEYRSVQQVDDCPAGYKRTEIGVVPEDWDVVDLESIIIKVGSGKTPKGGANVYISHGRPFVRSQNVGWGKLKLNDIAHISEEVHETFLGSELRQDDVLLNITGASIGRCSIASKELSGGNVNQHVCIIRVDTKKIDSRLICSLILSHKGQSQIDSFQAGGNREGLNFTQVKALKFALPTTKKEQTAIANALSDVDALITSLEKLIIKKRAIKTAVMQQLLTGKKRLPPFDKTHTGYKQTELGEMPEDWEVVALGGVAKFYKGRGLPKSELIIGGQKECIHYGELFTQYQEVVKEVISRTNIDYDAFLSSDNDVLMPTSDVTPNGLATASSLKKSGVILGGDVMIIRAAKEVLDSSFFAYLISISKDQIMQLVSGSTVYHLYGSDMAVFKFAKPEDVQEQISIANVLSDMAKEMSALEQRLTKTQQLKQGMMQELLTGKTRLINPEHGAA